MTRKIRIGVVGTSGWADFMYLCQPLKRGEVDYIARRVTWEARPGQVNAPLSEAARVELQQAAINELVEDLGHERHT